MQTRRPQQRTNTNDSSTYEKLIAYLSKSHPNYSMLEFQQALQTFRQEHQTLNGLSLTQLEDGILNVVRREYATEKTEIDSSRSEDSVAATLWSTFKRYRERERASSNNTDTNEDQCLICLEALSSNKTERFACEHAFHRACLEEWFKIERTCPLCRKLLLFTDEFPSLR